MGALRVIVTIVVAVIWFLISVGGWMNVKDGETSAVKQIFWTIGSTVVGIFVLYCVWTSSPTY